MPTDKPRYTITVTEDMLQGIDQHWHGNKFTTRTQATIDLIKRGMDKYLESAIIKTPTAHRIGRLCDELNDEGQAKVENYAQDLVDSGKYKKGTPAANFDEKGQAG